MAPTLHLTFSLRISRENTRPPRPEPAEVISLHKKSRQRKKRKKWKAPAEKKNASTQKKNGARAFVGQTAALFVFRTLRPRGMPPKFILLYVMRVNKN